MIKNRRTTENDRSDILRIIGNIEHPEIACTLDSLHMIIDVAVPKDKVNIAIALPAQNVPEQIRQIIEHRISMSLASYRKKISFVYFDMLPQWRSEFFDLAKRHWKVSTHKALCA